MASAPLIEDVLDRDLADAVYASPVVEEQFDALGIEMLDFGGGEFGITLPMILEISVRELSQVKRADGKKLGVRGAANLKSKLRSVMKHEPYY